MDNYAANQINRVISESKTGDFRLVISGDNTKTKNLNITEKQAQMIADILSNVFEVGEMKELEIPVHVKNFENDMDIFIQLYLFNEGEEDENVGLSNFKIYEDNGFEMAPVYYEIRHVQNGDALREYFPTTYKVIQARLMQVCKDKNLC
jgi:hypothetical protein